MHFLKTIIQSPALTDPANKYQGVHRHFYRYSKGDFEGPVIKISKTKPKITIKATFEYEDVVQELVASAVSKNEVEAAGVLITGSDINSTIMNLGFDWKLKKSTGKATNYKADIEESVNIKMLLDAIETFRASSYLLLSFNEGTNCKVTTKTRIPQPAKKKGEGDEEETPDKRLQFCTGVIPNTPSNEKLLLELVAPEFKSEISEKWKNIIMWNKYKVTDLEIPKNIKDSLLLRIMTIRKGVLFRIIDIDGERIEKQFKIVV